MKDRMRTLTMELPPPEEGFVWSKFYGDLPDEWEYFTDAAGAHWMQIEQYDSRCSRLDLSEYF